MVTSSQSKYIILYHLKDDMEISKAQVYQWVLYRNNI